MRALLYSFERNVNTAATSAVYPINNAHLQMICSAQVVVCSLQETQDEFAVAVIDSHLKLRLLSTQAVENTVQVLSKRLASLDLTIQNKYFIYFLHII